MTDFYLSSFGKKFSAQGGELKERFDYLKAQDKKQDSFF